MAIVRLGGTSIPLRTLYYRGIESSGDRAADAPLHLVLIDHILTVDGITAMTPGPLTLRWAKANGWWQCSAPNVTARWRLTIRGGLPRDVSLPAGGTLDLAAYLAL